MTDPSHTLKITCCVAVVIMIQTSAAFACTTGAAVYLSAPDEAAVVPPDPVIGMVAVLDPRDEMMVDLRDGEGTRWELERLGNVTSGFQADLRWFRPNDELAPGSYVLSVNHRSVDATRQFTVGSPEHPGQLEGVEFLEVDEDASSTLGSCAYGDRYGAALSLQGPDGLLEQLAFVVVRFRSTNGAETAERGMAVFDHASFDGSATILMPERFDCVEVTAGTRNGFLLDPVQDCLASENNAADAGAGDGDGDEHTNGAPMGDQNNADAGGSSGGNIQTGCGDRPAGDGDAALFIIVAGFGISSLRRRTASVSLRARRREAGR